MLLIRGTRSWTGRIALVLTVVVAFMASVGTASALSVQDNEREVCKTHGGLRGISRPFSYLPFAFKYSVSDNSSPCKRFCPQCIQYCYSYGIVCNDGAGFSIYSQVRPFISDYGTTYRSEDQQRAELAAIQIQEKLDNDHLAATAKWEQLSPWPQFILFAISIALTMIARRGLKDDDWRLPPLYLFNVYLGVSLLFFNVTAKGSSAPAHWLDTTLFFHSWLFITALGGAVSIGALPFIKGWDYYFVKHPAADIVNAATNHGTHIDRQALVEALRTEPEELHNPKPAYHYEHQAEKARKLKEKLDRDTELARAAIAREQARAELRDEKQASAEDLREQVWRGRTFR
jgi:hypothetical protein